MQEQRQKIAKLLPRGAQQKIADELGISRQAVGDALKRGKPSNLVVIKALEIARASGSLAAAQDLASLNP